MKEEGQVYVVDKRLVRIDQLHENEKIEVKQEVENSEDKLFQE